VNPAANTPAEKPAQDASRRSSAATDDAVELSRLSQAVSEPGASAAHLEQLKLEVESGTYRVPAEKLAKKIVDFHTK
jgi:flagellar biosynthesis anti-sigma factor FlgM